jgi:hypothetical protein
VRQNPLRDHRNPPARLIADAKVGKGATVRVRTATAQWLKSADSGHSRTDDRSAEIDPL